MSSNCSNMKKDSKPEEDKTKSVESNNVQSASQIIEDESATMNLSECVEDVSCLFFIFILFI